MPLYVTDLMAMKSLYNLDDEDVGRIVMGLCRAWMNGEPLPHDTENNAFNVLWENILAQRQEQEERATRLSERGKKAREAQLDAGKKPATSQPDASLTPVDADADTEVREREKKDSPPLAALAAPSGGAPRKPKAEKRAEKRWRQCPADYVPSATTVALGVSLGLDVTAELAAFRDYDFDKPKSRPDATFANWLRKATPRATTAAQNPRYLSAAETRASLAYLPQDGPESLPLEEREKTLAGIGDVLGQLKARIGA